MMQHRKTRALTLLLALALLLPLLPLASLAAPTTGDAKADNFVRLSAEAFSAGTADDGVAVLADLGDGALSLADGATDGVWESEELPVPAFEYLVASWSADVPEGAWVEISARAFVEMKGEWSGFLSWGKWSPYIKRASTDQKDAIARIDTDVFTILGSSGETSSLIQLRVTLHRDEAGGDAPVLRQVCATMKNTLEGQAIPVWQGDAPVELPESVLITAPAISQMTRDRAIGDVICSPTTVTMLLGARGEDLLPEEVALREYDFYYEGFGNWAFTVAMAGQYGYNSYCHYGNLDFLRQELAQGRTVGLSVRYSSSPNGSYPYLENGAAGSTGGHLISIVGYGVEDGQEYFYSNDSAAGSDAGCALRKYKAEQLDAAWSGRLCYVVDSVREEGAGQFAPARVEATLVPGSEDGLYAILVDGEPVTGLAANFTAKTTALGAGVAILIPDDAASTAGEGTSECLACHEMQYLTLSTGGELRAPDMPAGTLYLVVNNGPTYVADFEPVAATVAPIEPEPPTEPETPTEPTEPEEPAEPGSVAPWRTWLGVGIIVVGLLALAVTRRRSRVTATTEKNSKKK